DDIGNVISSGSQVPRESTIILNANLSIIGGDCECLIGIQVNFYINSTFGMMKISSGFTDQNKHISFNYDLSNILGQIGFFIELPDTQVAWQLLSQSQADFNLEVREAHEEELRFIDDPQIGGLIALGIILAAGGVGVMYLYVLYNAGRIFQGRKN
ncbi:MAG: hypothetical protein ACW98F_07875, partial [Candidatus Hodarchaeales archaeon]